jgi:phosphoribosyl-AMP cyclohydrolase
VHQDNVGGLQVERDGRLVDVPRRAGAYVVNLGEMLQLVSRGFLRATVHCVVPPPAGVSRLSVAYFFNPRLEATLAPVTLPSALAAQGREHRPDQPHPRQLRRELPESAPARPSGRRRPPPRRSPRDRVDRTPTLRLMPVATPIAATAEQLDAVRYNADGLVAAIVQEHGTGVVLMLAWMNAEVLRETLEGGRTVFWSRSRNERWRKGDTSGERQWVREAYYDCDGDTLLFVVEQEGAGACHTGAHSCFHRAFRADGDSPSR